MPTDKKAGTREAFPHGQFRFGTPNQWFRSCSGVLKVLGVFVDAPHNKHLLHGNYLLSK